MRTGINVALNSGGVRGLPNGAVGVWYADQYQASPRPYVPNAVGSRTAPKSHLSIGRRGFVNGPFTRTNVTVTDSNAVAQDGSNDATTVVWGSVDGFVQMNDALAAATYTLSVEVKTTDAATVNFRMGPNASMTTKTATGSWQTFSVTFVHAGGSPSLHIVRSVDSAHPANLAICDARIHVGNADLGKDTLEGNLLLGSTSGANLPTVNASPPTLETTAGGWGLVQFPAVNSGSSFTIIAIAKRTAATANVVQSMLVSFGTASGYQQFGPLYSNGGDVSPLAGGAGDMWVGGTAMFGSQRPGLLSPATGLFEAIGCRYDGTTASIFLNDSKILSKTSAGKTFSVADYIFQRYTTAGGAGTSAKQACHAIAYWNRALTDAEVRQAMEALRSRAVGYGVSVNTQPRFIWADGDSITFGTSASYGYPDLFGPNASPAVVGVNSALASATLNGNGGNSLSGRLAAATAAIPSNKRGRLYIYTMMIGRNELVGYAGGATQYAADIATHAANVKAAGYDRVGICTNTPSTLANFNTQRALLNAIFTGVGWAAAHSVDFIIPFAADATMGTDAAASDVSLYGDGTHPTNLGQTNLEVIYRAAVNAVV